MKYPKTFFALATLAILFLTLTTTATAQDTGISVLETPVADAPVSNLESPLVVTYSPVIYYRSPTLVQRFFTRTVTVPVVTTTPIGQVTAAGYSNATVRAAILPRLKARRLASGYSVQAQAVSTSTVLVH